MKRELPIYEAKIQDGDDTGIFAMSFVEVPAVEKHFIALKAANKVVKLKLSHSRQILTGVVLTPDQLIYRNDDKLGEYYLKYTAADIERIAQKMMRVGVALRTTTHQHESPLAGNYLTEVWLVEDPKRDKSVALGLGEQIKGTLCASYKVTDKKYWTEQVLTGKVKGFSLEGLFNYNNVKISEIDLTKRKAAQLLGKKGVKGTTVTFLKSLTAMLEGDTVAETDALADVAKVDEVDAGTPYLIFELADGGEVYVDAEGFATLDDEQMPAGEHALADGSFLVIDDAGQMVITAPDADGAEAEVAAAALAAQVAAKKRGTAYLAKLKAAAKVKPADAKSKQIAALKAQIVALEKEPSTAKVKPAVDEKEFATLSHTEKLAVVLKNQLDRKNGR